MKTILASTVILFVTVFSSQAQVTRFSYDQNGNMSKVSLSGGNNLCKLSVFSPEEEESIESLKSIQLEEMNTESPEGKHEIKVFPNPTRGVVNVQFSSLDQWEASISIYNLLGQRIAQQQAQGSTQLNLRGQSPGTYIVQISDSSGLLGVERIVLQ